jgi:hypothetical protein
VTEEAVKLLHEPLTATESTAAGRAAEVLASSLGLCVLSSEEQLQLPCIAPFIERLESMRYVCRACVPGRTNEEHYRAFCELKEQEGGASFFAWHGSPFKNWPSIIATGLKVSVFVCFCERAFWLACLSVGGRGAREGWVINKYHHFNNICMTIEYIVINQERYCGFSSKCKCRKGACTFAMHLYVLRMLYVPLRVHTHM